MRPATDGLFDSEGDMGRMALFGLLAASCVLAGCASLRPVEEGAVYRSGQLSARQLEQVVAQQGIRTVVNLRGPQQGARWYDNQHQLCQQLGIQQVDVDLSGSTPDPREVAALLDAYRTAERPMLIHSWSRDGSVGLAAGLYRAEMLGQAPRESRQELAWWQSHRWPLKSLSEHDRMLLVWSSPDSRGVGAGMRDESLISGNQRVAPPPGSLLPLPAPSSDLFQGANAYADQQSESRYSAPDGAARLAWLGSPIGLR